MEHKCHSVQESCAHDHPNGENHSHEQGHSCGQCHCGCHSPKVKLTFEETVFLDLLAKEGPLPVTRFVMRSTKSEHFEAVAMDPVYLENAEEDLKKVRERAVWLENLEQYTLVEIDYDRPLESGRYILYESSALYAYFVATIEEAKANPEFVFDTAFLEKGSIRLTDIGAQIAQASI